MLYFLSVTNRVNNLNRDFESVYKRVISQSANYIYSRNMLKDILKSLEN